MTPDAIQVLSGFVLVIRALHAVTAILAALRMLSWLRSCNVKVYAWPNCRRILLVILYQSLPLLPCICAITVAVAGPPSLALQLHLITLGTIDVVNVMHSRRWLRLENAASWQSWSIRSFMALLWLYVIAGVVYVDETFPNAYGNIAVLGSSCLISAYLWYQARPKEAMNWTETWRYSLCEMWEILISMTLLLLAIIITVAISERHESDFRDLPAAVCMLHPFSFKATWHFLHVRPGTDVGNFKILHTPYRDEHVNVGLRDVHTSNVLKGFFRTAAGGQVNFHILLEGIGRRNQETLCALSRHLIEKDRELYDFLYSKMGLRQDELWQVLQSEGITWSDCEQLRAQLEGYVNNSW